MSQPYVFKWRWEVTFALITFAVYVLGEFVVTDDMSVDEWQTWLVATLVGAARAVAAAIIPRLVALLSTP